MSNYLVITDNIVTLKFVTNTEIVEDGFELSYSCKYYSSDILKQFCYANVVCQIVRQVVCSVYNKTTHQQKWNQTCMDANSEWIIFVFGIILTKY